MGVAPAVRNFWPDAKCAKAFWSQQELRPYRKLLTDTIDWCAPGAGERWLDLGCGSGPLSAALWERSNGAVAEVVGLDCAAVNEQAYAKLRKTLTPPPGDRVRFDCHNFSDGLSQIPAGLFDHAVSGLSITYAEAYSAAEGRWTTDAYDTVLAEVLRVIRPGGRFVFSVNVPEPSWLRVALGSLGGAFRARRPLEYLKRSWRMMRYGAWLKREARTGRFHYLPAAEVAAKLAAAGYTRVEHRLSYSRQAFIFRAVKPTR
jgi:ubiquinone/menaquinone biosynthesis C-methylase UbiE